MITVNTSESTLTPLRTISDPMECTGAYYQMMVDVADDSDCCCTCCNSGTGGISACMTCSEDSEEDDGYCGTVYKTTQPEIVVTENDTLPVSMINQEEAKPLEGSQYPERVEERESFRVISMNTSALMLCRYNP